MTTLTPPQTTTETCPPTSLNQNFPCLYFFSCVTLAGSCTGPKDQMVHIVQAMYKPNLGKRRNHCIHIELHGGSHYFSLLTFLISESVLNRPRFMFLYITSWPHPIPSAWFIADPATMFIDCLGGGCFFMSIVGIHVHTCSLWLLIKVSFIITLWEKMTLPYSLSD